MAKLEGKRLAKARDLYSVLGSIVTSLLESECHGPKDSLFMVRGGLDQLQDLFNGRGGVVTDHQVIGLAGALVAFLVDHSAGVVQGPEHQDAPGTVVH